MNKLKLTLLSFYFVVCSIVCANPARIDSILVKQTNGDSIWLNQRGDEHFSWVETPDGYYLIENKSASFQTFNLKPLKKQGLLIYHIHSSIGSATNISSPNSSLPLKCYLVNPHSSSSMPATENEYGEAQYAYFPDGDIVEDNYFFTTQTNPRSQSWAGESTCVDICFIQHNGDNIDFVVNPQLR